ncbi:MAG TPA: hypothetical protein VHN99_09175, partial [Deinococcales bacterium]|nr:hypothetical protein [Deinococcales bacterium]
MNIKGIVGAAILAAGMGLAGNAAASNYFGVRLGYPEVGLQVGSTNLFGPHFGGRITADFWYGAGLVALNGDALYSIPLGTPGAGADLDFYFGGGLGVVLDTSGAQALGYNVHGVLGLGLVASKDVTVFLETRPGLL